jgi:hypothetical protein
MIEAYELCENISGNKINYGYINENQIGDHIRYIGGKLDLKITIEVVIMNII